MSITDLFAQDLTVINVGSPGFIADLDHQRVRHTHLNWKPPAGGNPKSLEALARLVPHAEAIRRANSDALKKIQDSRALLVAVSPARDVIPGMHDRLLLHAGPPIEWNDMAGPMRGAILGALVYENLASDLDEASELVESGSVEFDSAHEHGAVGPMAGVISPSMPVHVIHDPVHDAFAYCTINEGLGKVLRYGANGPDVLDRLRWIEKTFAPLLNEALALSGPIDIKNIAAQALHMGDECHNRNKAATSLFYREIAEWIVRTRAPEEDVIAGLRFVKNNEHYFLNLSMPMCKVSLESTRSTTGSTLVSIMARNGNQFGIKLAHSDKWYCAPANYVKGLMFPGFTEGDAAPDIGDSAITETYGIGGFAMGAAPAIVQFVGGQVRDAFDYTRQMNEICVGSNAAFSIPTLDFAPTAQGIDVLKVVESGILPVINTGMAHKEAGIGQVGAGIVRPPLACFEHALEDFARTFADRRFD